MQKQSHDLFMIKIETCESTRCPLTVIKQILLKGRNRIENKGEKKPHIGMKKKHKSSNAQVSHSSSCMTKELLPTSFGVRTLQILAKNGLHDPLHASASLLESEPMLQKIGL